MLKHTPFSRKSTVSSLLDQVSIKMFNEIFPVHTEVWKILDISLFLILTVSLKNFKVDIVRLNLKYIYYKRHKIVKKGKERLS